MRKLSYKVVNIVHSIVKGIFAATFILIHFGTGVAIYVLAGKGLIGVLAGFASLLFPVVNILVTILWSWYVVGNFSSNYVAFAFQFFGLGLILVILTPIKIYLAVTI